MSKRFRLRLLAHSLACGLTIYLSPIEARAQNAGDHLLRRSIIQAQDKMIAAAKGCDDDGIAMIFSSAMKELNYYKTEYKITNEIAQSPCQKSYEELSMSAIKLSTYVQPNRQTFGPVDRAGDGREADEWWISHRETFAECERYLRLPQSPHVGPERITSVLPQ